MKRSLILLTYNEIEAAPKVLENVPLDCADEVIAVDGGSQDGTIDFLRSKGLRVAVQEKRGRGIAFQVGMEESQGDHVVYFSLDGNEDPDDIPKLFAVLEEGADIAIASRMMRGAFNEEDVQWIRLRKWVNHLFSNIANILWNRGCYVTDTINGFRGITRKAFAAACPDADGFVIEYQMSIRAMKKGMKIVEIPTHEGQRLGGESTAKSFPTGVIFIKQLLKEIRLGRAF
ncbi:MAG: glycosyltransferase family 2 protein [Elusimicrobiota bacterium]